MLLSEGQHKQIIVYKFVYESDSLILVDTGVIDI